MYCPGPGTPESVLPTGLYSREHGTECGELGHPWLLKGEHSMMYLGMGSTEGRAGTVQYVAKAKSIP